MQFTPDNFNNVLCINVSILDDLILEDREYFSLSLCSDDKFVTFKDDFSSVWIEDDDCKLHVNLNIHCMRVSAHACSFEVLQYYIYYVIVLYLFQLAYINK